MTFEEALWESYLLYIQRGPRSPEKLRPLHGWFAKTLKNRLDAHRYIVQDLNSPEGEAQLEGRYFPKRVDIAIFTAITSGQTMRRPIVAVSIRFIGSNFKQNANNYFENLLGECANLRRKRIGFAHFLVLPLLLPYKDRSGEIIRYEEIEETTLSKYFLLYEDDEHPHRPDVLGLALVKIPDLDNLLESELGQNKISVCIPEDFSSQAQDYLRELSVEVFLRRIVGLCELKA